MKKIKNYSIIAILGLATLMTSCKKDPIVGAKGDKGETGANGLIGATGAAGTNGTNGAQGQQGQQGIAGANGTNGTNGNANVKSTTFNVAAGDWITLGTSGVYYNKAFASLTQDIVDNGLVMCYLKSGSAWVALPVTTGVEANIFVIYTGSFQTGV